VRSQKDLKPTISTFRSLSKLPSMRLLAPQAAQLPLMLI
jgi:hypothetical protein